MSKAEDWFKFLDRCIRDPEHKEEVNESIDHCITLIREGYGTEEIRKRLGIGKRDNAIITEIGHSRINIQGKFEKWNRLWMDDYLSRYSTPEAVCRYRAKRIENFSIIEAGSGAGMQSIFLSMSNSSTLGIELRPERFLMARLNAMEYRTRNLKYLNGDIYALSPSFEIDGNTLIFSDPARPPAEGERKMGSLLPSPEALIKVFGGKTSNFVFDLPPQMAWERITIPGEKEYLSIDGSLNRLTLYCGALSRNETSAVVLPSGAYYGGIPREPKPSTDYAAEEYLLIPDISMVYAKLLWKLEDEFAVTPLMRDRRRHIYTSHQQFDDFPGEQYRVLDVCGKEQIHSRLAETGAGRAFPRFSIPDTEYYAFRKELESGLAGSRDAYIFLNGEQYIIAEKVS